MRANGKKKRKLTSHPEGDADIFTMRANGKRQRRVAHFLGDDDGPDWAVKPKKRKKKRKR